MPIKKGKDEKGCFVKYGDSGTKYHYTCGSEEGLSRARQKAIAQGLAISKSIGEGLKLEKVVLNDYPEAAVENAKRALKWIDEKGRDVVKAGTRVGLARANQLVNRENLSRETLGRIKSFLERHDTNAEISPEYKGKPWLDRGYVAFLLWGGIEMLAWVDKKINQIDNQNR
jgi:hypothetical protein